MYQEAKVNLEITDDDEAQRAWEILDEATQIFEDDLMPEEQEEMRISGEVKSDFKQRAIAAAQRREAAQKGQEQPAEQPEVVVEHQQVEKEVVDHEEQPEAHEELVEEVEEYVEQEGEDLDGAVGETITQTVTKTVAEDGTQIITTKTTKRTVTEQKESKTVVCCTLL